jgi:cysteine desulfurase
MTDIYLDHAASTPVDPEVAQHLFRMLTDLPGNPSSTHRHGRALKAELESSRRKLAGLLNVSPAEIYFTSGGTEADNIAITGTIAATGIKRIISCEIEHHAVTHPISHLENEGKVEAIWLQPDKMGRIIPVELVDALKDHTPSLVCLMHGNNELGTLLDLHEIGTICREYGAIFHSDTVQAIGHTHYDLAQTPVDFITASAHKFNGPKGIGFLYIRQGIKVKPLLTGGGQERNIRPGTENVAAISAMVFAIEKAWREREARRAHLLDLKAYMQAQLRNQIEGVEFNGDISEEGSMPHVLNVALPAGERDAMLVFNLDLRGISVSGGSACNSGALKGSHVLTGIGCEAVRAVNSVRFSFGQNNTREEIDQVILHLKDIVGSQLVA